MSTSNSFCFMLWPLSITVVPEHQESYKGTATYSCVLDEPPQPSTQTLPHPTFFLFCIYITSSSGNPLSASAAKASLFNGCHPPGITEISNSVQVTHLQPAMLKGCSWNKAKFISLGKIKIRGCCHLTSLSKDVASCSTASSSSPVQTNSEIGPCRR